MSRKMSFALTKPQFINRTKTVTRRFGWKFLKPGDIVDGVEKAMGLKKGEKMRVLGQIRIISNTPEPLNAITQDECIKEGFPEFAPKDFVDMIIKTYRGKTPESIINRIEFEYVDEYAVMIDPCLPCREPVTVVVHAASEKEAMKIATERVENAYKAEYENRKKGFPIRKGYRHKYMTLYKRAAKNQ